MKIGFLICVMMLTVSATPLAVEPEAFEKARVIGAGEKRSFYLFSTSIAKYVIRHDGLGEAALNGRRQLFYLKLGKGRLEQVYFHEYQGDLVLLYEVSDGDSSVGYVVRMNQQSKKKRWFTSIEASDIGPCRVEGNEAHCGAAGETKIDLNTGAYGGFALKSSLG